MGRKFKIQIENVNGEKKLEPLKRWIRENHQNIIGYVYDDNDNSHTEAKKLIELGYYSYHDEFNNYQILTKSESFQLKNNDSINSKSIKINQVKKQDLSIEQSKNLFQDKITDKENQKRLTEEIIETAYSLLTQKFAFGGLTARNESSFQLEFGHILKTLGELYEFRLTDKFHLEFETYISLSETSIKSKSDKARVDLLLKYQDDNTTTTAAIELKFFKKENHREPNNRYDVFKDISNLELYKNHNIDICYFILATDHDHYYDQKKYSQDTSDFDFRDGKSYKAGTKLQYKTDNPYGQDISLNQDYNFTWDKINDSYFLKLKV